MERVKRLIHTDYAYRHGLSGKGVTVAFMDTGIVPHADFGRRILAFRDFCNGKNQMYDDNGHGTHVAGIVAGDGSMSKDRSGRGARKMGGVAPQANIVMLKVLDAEGNGSTSTVLKGAEWLISVKEQYHIRVLNISVGMLPSAGISEQEALLSAVNEIWDSGIMVVAAAGNNGPGENSVTIPGISRRILTVGSSDDDIIAARGLNSGYSGRGPTECCIVKPEILAPGTNIVSCSRNGKGYQVKSGTSMAAPVVTGALALAFEKYPYLSPAEMKLRVYERAYPRGEQMKKKCWGQIHVENLLR